MEYGNRITFCHVYLIQDPKSSPLGALVNGPFPKFYLIIDKCVCTDETAAVCVHMERNIINRSSKNPGQIFRQDILSCSLISAEEKILSFQKGGHRPV